MLSNLNRLGLSNQASLESRLLAVDMASTLYWWDAKAAESAAVADESQPMDILEDKADEKSDTMTGLRLTASMEDSIINFLLRMAFVR